MSIAEQANDAADAARRDAMHGDQIAVLTDGGQDPGLAALVNSLFRNGFGGTLWIGWRDSGAAMFADLPPEISQQVTIRLVEVETRRPLSNYKPEFLELVWDLAEQDSTSVTYMDCDLVLGCRWELVHAWLSGGLAVVEDLPQRTVGASHPLRHAWTAFMSSVGVDPVRESGQYFNSGFVGIPVSCRSILPVWRAFAEAIERTPALTGSAPRHYLRGVPLSGDAPVVAEEVLLMMRAFLLDDQDALNMAVMASDVPIVAMGPDAMGFTDAMAPLLVHPVGPNKPWNSHYLRRLARHGAGPTIADDLWWTYSGGPLRIQPPMRRAARRATYLIAKALRRYV